MERRTGVVVPLGALYTKDSVPVGDFLALKPLADFCKQCGLSVIQLLPVNDTGTHSSPYSGLSAFALHPLYLRIEALPEFEEAKKSDKAFAAAYKRFCKEFTYQSRFDYGALCAAKTELLHLLFAAVQKKVFPAKKSSSKATNTVTVKDPDAFATQFTAQLDAFTAQNPWVIPYAVFKDLKDDYSQSSWKSWPEEKQRMTARQIEIRWANKALRPNHLFFVWCQMRAAEQFKEAADYVRGRGIVLKGDIPIMMNEDSVDCWATPQFFTQELRAGSPPDGENPLGQNWGFPTYDWEALAKDGYRWWRDRVKVAARYYSAFRIDHILGFFRIWAVNEHDATAYLGHTEPYCDCTRAQLNELGFDDGRITWLSKPHIPTKVVEDVTWNHEEAHAILRSVATQIGTEELWNFKDEIRSDGDLYQKPFDADFTRDRAIKDALAEKWRDRALIEIAPDRFVPVWSYGNATAWGTLSAQEQETLRELFARLDREQNELWGERARAVLTPIVQETGMQSCAEDLGAGLAVLPGVLKALDIFSLKVIRWNRDWGAAGQPFVPFADYPEESVATTSVHDSSTLRQWWSEEKPAVEAYRTLVCGAGKDTETPAASAEFSPEAAEFLLCTGARCNSAWYVNPLQDYLFLDGSYYLENPDDERINVPGSVNTFNWTYRLPQSLETLGANAALTAKIQNIATIHNSGAPCGTQGEAE